MDLSRRVQALRPSPTLAVTAKAKELQSKGVKVISFAAGEPDFDTPPRITQAAIDALSRGQTHYGPVPGDPASRKAIADKLTRENGIPGTTPDHVVISAGGKQSLYQVFQALLDPPERGEAQWDVLLPVPAWVSFAPQAVLAGGRVVELPTGPRGDFKITPDQLHRALSPRSRILVINSPSNPCGTMYTPDELKALARTIGDSVRGTSPDLVIVSDETYEKVIFGGIPHFSIGSVPDLAERTVTVNTLSKSYAMTGWRIGYSAGSGEFGLRLAKAIAALQSQSTTSIPTFLMPAIPVALLECADDVEKMRLAFAARAELTFSLMQRIPGVICARPTGAFYVFPDISSHFGKRTPAGAVVRSPAEFAQALLEEKHVAVIPGEEFGAGGEKCFRLTFACSEQEIKDGIARISDFVASLR